MGSIHVVPNNGRLTPALESAISNTYNGEKEKCEAEDGDIKLKTFVAKLRPVMSVIE